MVSYTLFFIKRKGKRPGEMNLIERLESYTRHANGEESALSNLEIVIFFQESMRNQYFPTV